MTTPQLSHPMRRTIPSPAAVAITLSWTVFTLTPSFAVDVYKRQQQSDPRRIDTQALRHQRCVQNRVGGLFGGEYKRKFCRHFFGIIG